MDHVAGLDVLVKQTSVCIVDDTGRMVREMKVASEPEALLAILTNPIYRFKRIGLKAGPLSQWLFSALAEAGLAVICVETRHMRAVLQAQINKTDRNDARGIAQMMRAGLYRPVHVKTLRSQKLRMLLTHRKLLQSKAIAIDNDLRGTLRNFGLKVGVVGALKFEARIRELVENLPDLAELVEPMLIVRRTLREQIGILHGRLLAIVRNDDVCRRLMTVPGVGPVVALTYRATVDVPARFRTSKAVGAVFGLTPSKYQSGEINRSGAISRCGDEMMRAMLYEAAHIMLVRVAKWSWLKAWAMKIAKRRGMNKAIVALARRLAVILLFLLKTPSALARSARAAKLMRMIDVLSLLAHILVSPFKTKARLEAEIVMLRHQLNVLRRRVPSKPKSVVADRLLFVWLYPLFPAVLNAVTIIQPETVFRWHRTGVRLYWRWKSRSRGGRPQVPGEMRHLIREMSLANPLWGAPRIHGELLEMGIEIAQSTVPNTWRRVGEGGRRRGKPFSSTLQLASQPWTS